MTQEQKREIVAEYFADTFYKVLPGEKWHVISIFIGQLENAEKTQSLDDSFLDFSKKTP